MYTGSYYSGTWGDPRCCMAGACSRASGRRVVDATVPPCSVVMKLFATVRVVRWQWYCNDSDSQGGVGYREGRSFANIGEMLKIPVRLNDSREWDLTQGRRIRIGVLQYMRPFLTG
eukprot:gene9152-biopygen3395